MSNNEQVQYTNGEWSRELAPKIDRAAEAWRDINTRCNLSPPPPDSHVVAIIRRHMDAETAALRAQLAAAEKRLEEARELVDYVFCSTDGCPHKVCCEAEAKAWIAAHDAAGKRGGA